MMNDIFVPLFGMMLLTMGVWVLMYIRRLGFLQQQGIDPQELVTPENITRLVPESINAPSNNLKILFELPVLFYGLCLYLYQTTQVDALYVWMAYGFLGLRVIHSVIHCTYNKVMHRFIVYMLSSIVLWVMLVRAAINL
jgi:hypothetical protein